MNVEYKDFIGIFNDVFPNGYCEHLINEFEIKRKESKAYSRLTGENCSDILKNDYSCVVDFRDNFNNFQEVHIRKLFFNGLQSCFDNYIKKFGHLENGKMTAYIMKMQMTPPGGGYHAWHAEQGPGPGVSDRVLVYMLYLNTLKPEEAGETEFLYQKLRFSPIQNQLIIWPASFTHTHRGNVVFGDKSKYVVTGWFNYD